MKGSRAKKAAEAAAASEGGGGSLVPTAPSEPRSGPPRPGPVVGPSTVHVQIPEEVFKRICANLRTNELLGPAAADALEEAAGLRGPSGPQGKAAKELRSNVAENRDDDDQKAKKKVGGFADQVDEIPDVPVKGRASIMKEQMDAAHDLESAANHPEKDAPEPPELNLTPKQNHMRTDLEMWVMDEIPALYGVDDSDELDEDLQEDSQALKVTQLIAAESPEEMKKLLVAWLKGVPDAGSAEAFMTEMMDKAKAIQDLGGKKKKKKKKAEA